VPVGISIYYPPSRFWLFMVFLLPDEEAKVMVTTEEEARWVLELF